LEKRGGGEEAVRKRRTRRTRSRRSGRRETCALYLLNVLFMNI
jgi:hypothetical protein